MNGKIPVSFKISLLENKKANEYYSKLHYKTKEDINNYIIKYNNTDIIDKKILNIISNLEDNSIDFLINKKDNDKI